jgi:hypothetical protein
MKNIDRAKQFQRRLWEAVGKEWKEEDFDDRWIVRPYGQDWDFWYESGLVPVNFCALCGDDQLSGAYRSNNHSRHNVKVFICNACAATQGFDINPTTNGIMAPYEGHPILTGIAGGLNIGVMLSGIATVGLAFLGEWKWASLSLGFGVVGYLLWHKLHNRVTRQQ